MSFLTRCKALPALGGAARKVDGLKPTLSWPHLVALGVGAIVGTGIYTLIGVGAERAGPAVMLAFVIAGIVCVCAALAYAELATMIPESGSAYTYSYTTLGEGAAWMVGWSLILEYTVVCSAVAVGWAGYFSGMMEGIGMGLLAVLTSAPSQGGIVNLPAVVIVAAVAGLLVAGTKESASINAALVVVKIAALIAFVAIALPHFNADNLKPFMPYGFSHGVGAQTGVMAAAAIIFFAFYGFDAVATAAEETRNPARDLTIGIIGSMVACVAIYMAVAIAALGAMPFTEFMKSPEPLSHIIRTVGSDLWATLIAGAAVVALPTVILAFMFGQSRIFFVMARDGLLPRSLAHVSKRSGGPVRVTAGTAVLMAIIAGFIPLGDLAALANAGTLAAFASVGLCLIVLRRREPSRPRVFRAPVWWLVGPIAIAGCIYLFFSLPASTHINFVIWNVIGVAVYLLYSRRNSLLNG
nr:amino acid permease [Brevundimonas naejangsanensis]